MNNCTQFLMRELNRILPEVEKYYSEKIASYGPNPQRADWKSAESQSIRFDQLLRLLGTDGLFSINDYGCGYGALVDYLESRGHQFLYRGFDISEKMISEARQGHDRCADREFFSKQDQLSPADYTVASGIFNVKLQNSDSDWLEYITSVLHEFSQLSTKAFAFNALTSYADAEFMRPHLYYANPLQLFDYCKKHFSPKVSLLHDYPLYEFTIVVQKLGGKAGG